MSKKQRPGTLLMLKDQWKELVDAWRCPYCDHRVTDAGDMGEKQLRAFVVKIQIAIQKRYLEILEQIYGTITRPEERVDTRLSDYIAERAIVQRVKERICDLEIE